MAESETIFDGKTIHVPKEMIDAKPGKVKIIYDTREKAGHSIWDIVGRNPHPLNAEQMKERLQELRADRDEWDND